MASKSDKELAHSIRDLVTRMQRRLRKQISNPDQLSIAELNVLSLLVSGPELPSVLCAQLNLSSQYMSQVLQRLQGLGYISRKACREDRRSSFAQLTASGRAKVMDTREEREQWLAGLISGRFTAAEKRLIRQAVGLLAELPDLE